MKLKSIYLDRQKKKVLFTDKSKTSKFDDLLNLIAYIIAKLPDVVSGLFCIYNNQVFKK